jgi:hypothetical protein
LEQITLYCSVTDSIKEKPNMEGVFKDTLLFNLN